MKFARYICAGEISSRDPSEGSQEISCTGLFMDSKLQADFREYGGNIGDKKLSEVHADFSV